ncbi:MAG: hypothetical protein LC799_06990, partial [Actinobacteria bacterium]|nr:hypothetical protein [Actinomycetota bacterium]
DRWDSAVPLPAARVVERVDPLALRADEHQLMRLLGPPLITTPRAVKRLANSYGLLAAIRRHRSPDRPDPQAGPTGGQDSDDVLDRPAMVLLAALIGFPSLGPALFTHLHHTAAVRPSCTWLEFLTQLAPTPIVGGWCNPADPRLTPVQERHWRALLAALTQLTHSVESAGIPLLEPLPAWARWVVPVGRLSFPTDRVVSDLDRHPPTDRCLPQATPNGTVHSPGSLEGPPSSGRRRTLTTTSERHPTQTEARLVPLLVSRIVGVTPRRDPARPGQRCCTTRVRKPRRAKHTAMGRCAADRLDVARRLR